MSASDRTEELAELIRYHSELYFNGTPEISDKEFDELVAEMKDLDPEHPVLSEVGATPSYGKTVEHPEIMGSLDKVYSAQEVYNRLNTWRGAIVITPKIDGGACRLEYDSKLMLAATRGNGRVGQDVTDNAYEVDSVPKELPGMSGELRGEIYMKRSVFKALRESGLTMANPRNAANGAIACKDPKDTRGKKLDFFCYDARMDGEPKYETEMERREWLEEAYPDIEFVPMERIKGGRDMVERIQEAIDRWSEARPNLDYEIDGLVFSVNSLAMQAEAGMHGKCPWAKVAYKFPAEQVETIVLDIIWQVGRTGKITPVAILQPVQLAGTTVSKATLHSLSQIRETLDVAIGDKVLLEKAGDIIPQIVRVLERAEERNINQPHECPSCGETTEADKVNVWCRNGACPAKNQRRLLEWFKVLDTKGIGPGSIGSMVAEGLVKDLPDFYKMDEAALRHISFGDGQAKNIIKARDSKRKLPLAVFLQALSVESLGQTTAKDIAKKLETVEAILQAKKSDFVMPGIGETTAEKIYNGLQAIYETIDELLKFVDVEDCKKVEGSLSGKSFCITGSLPSGRKRKEVEAEIEAAGGEVYSSVKKGLTYLLMADPDSTSSKAVKARKEGVTCISEEQYMEILGGH